MSWKESFSMGVVNPHKLKNCNECSKDISCDGCVKLVNKTKEISANLNEIGKPPPDEMVRWFYPSLVYNDLNVIIVIFDHSIMKCIFTG